MTSVKKLAISGMLWTIASYGASQFLRFGSNLILTRLLFPKLFGLMALVNTLVLGLQLFSDIGIGPSIIQNQRGDDRDFLNTAWTIQIIRGFCLWFCAVLLTWPIAKFYEDPLLLSVFPVLALNTIINGFNSTNMFTLTRHMAIRRLVIFELCVQSIFLSVMITWAWLSPTIWAVVISTLVGDLVRALWSHRLISGSSNRLCWNQDAAKAIFAFGRWIFLSTAVTFVGMQADRLILGKLISFELLGVYGIAYTLADMPRQVMGAISSKVILPACSKFASVPRQTFRAKLLQNRRLILVPAALIVALMVSCGDILITTLYDQRYAQAAWMLPILAIGIWPNLLPETIRQSLFAIGKPKYQAYAQLCKSIYMCIALPIGFFLGGILGAVIVVALNDIPLYGVIAYGLWCEKLECVKQDIVATALLFTLIALILMVRNLLGLGLPLSQMFAF